MILESAGGQHARRLAAPGIEAYNSNERWRERSIIEKSVPGPASAGMFDAIHCIVVSCRRTLSDVERVALAMGWRLPPHTGHDNRLLRRRHT